MILREIYYEKGGLNTGGVGGCQIPKACFLGFLGTGSQPLTHYLVYFTGGHTRKGVVEKGAQANGKAKGEGISRALGVKRSIRGWKKSLSLNKSGEKKGEKRPDNGGKILGATGGGITAEERKTHGGGFTKEKGRGEKRCKEKKIKKKMRTGYSPGDKEKKKYS